MHWIGEANQLHAASSCKELTFQSAISPAADPPRIWRVPVRGLATCCRSVSGASHGSGCAVASGVSLKSCVRGIEIRPVAALAWTHLHSARITLVRLSGSTAEGAVCVLSGFVSASGTDRSEPAAATASELGGASVTSAVHWMWSVCWIWRDT